MTLPPKDLNIAQFVLQITRAEIEAGDTQYALRTLNEMLDPDRCRQLRQKMLLAVNGYDDDPRDLWEITEVRRWFLSVDAKWPYWLFFLDPGKRSSLAVIAFTLCGYTVISEGGMFIEDGVLQSFWQQKIAAMNVICERIGDNQPTKDEMARRACAFFGGSK